MMYMSVGGGGVTKCGALNPLLTVSTLKSTEAVYAYICVCAFFNIMSTCTCVWAGGGEGFMTCCYFDSSVDCLHVKIY